MVKINLSPNIKKPSDFKKYFLLSLACLTVPTVMGTSSLESGFLSIFKGEETTPLVELPQEEVMPEMTYEERRIQAMMDENELIDAAFDIPDNLRDRVGFWFDIYALHDSNKKVIHHSLFPWIIYKVVDVSDIINAEKPKARWMRNQRAEDHVKKELAMVRQALKNIASKGKANPDNETETLVLNALEALPGHIKNKARKALHHVRSQTGQKDHFASALEVSPLYLSGMEEIFEQHRLPKELTRLPFVESSFNKHAVSKVGASGIWQFMSYTGKSFMTVDQFIDERKSPFKATQAAAKLLKENHMILRRSWPLAITAWNHGPPGVRRAIQRTGSQDLGKMLAHPAKTFDFASTNFYAEFLAALYVEKYHDILFDNLDYEKTLDLHAVRLLKATRTQTLFNKSGLSKDDFLFFNPDLRKAFQHNSTIPRGFTVMVDTPARVLLSTLITKDTRAPINESIAEISQK